MLSASERSQIQKLLRKTPVPDEDRLDLWLLASGALQTRLAYPFDYYSGLCSFCEKLLASGYPLPAASQLEIDLPRTLSNPFYKHMRGESFLEKVRKICIAFAVRNPLLGYC